MNCSECGKFEAYVVESRLRLDGRRYRRYACEACGNRWTVYQNHEPQDVPAVPIPVARRRLPYIARRYGRKLTNWEAAEILMAEGMSTRELADKYQVSTTVIQKILAGKFYREVFQVLNPH